MKKTYCKYSVLLVIMVMTMNLSFSQEVQSQEPQSRYKAPISEFRQMKNSEWVTLLESLIRPDSPYSLEEALETRQKQYIGFLQMVLYNFYAVDRDDWFNAKLDLSDLQKLEWIIKTNKNTYLPGEPIGFKVGLRNISTEKILIFGGNPPRGFYLCSMALTKTGNGEEQDVYLTKLGYQYNGNLYFEGYNRLTRVSSLFKPGEERIGVNHELQTLNPYYDLSEPGEYELTFYTRNFLGSDDEQIGEYPKPCTIRFKIEGNTNWLDSQVVWPEE